MTPEDHAQAAADLLQAERTGQQIDLLSLRHPDIGMDDAYAIQNAIYRAKLAAGRRVADLAGDAGRAWHRHSRQRYPLR